MRTLSNALILWYAATQSPKLSTAKATTALQAMSNEDFEVVQAAYDAAHPEIVATTADGIKHPTVSVFQCRIVDITELQGDNAGASAVSIVTASNKALSFVATNAQVGDNDKKGFGLRVGGYVEVTVEERIAKTTQYVDKDTQAVKFHEKNGYGFVTSKAIDGESFTIAAITANTNPAVQNALLQMRLAKMNAGILD